MMHFWLTFWCIGAAFQYRAMRMHRRAAKNSRTARILEVGCAFLWPVFILIRALEF
jgi:hypothetical protein